MGAAARPFFLYRECSFVFGIVVISVVFVVCLRLRSPFSFLAVFSCTSPVESQHVPSARRIGSHDETPLPQRFEVPHHAKKLTTKSCSGVISGAPISRLQASAPPYCTTKFRYRRNSFVAAVFFVEGDVFVARAPLLNFGTTCLPCAAFSLRPARRMFPSAWLLPPRVQAWSSSRSCKGSDISKRGALVGRRWRADTHEKRYAEPGERMSTFRSRHGARELSNRGSDAIGSVVGSSGSVPELSIGI